MPLRSQRPRRSVDDLTPAVTQASPRNWPRLRRMLIDAVQMATQTVLIFVLLTTVVGRFEIRQTSMQPNFVAGQRVIVSQLGSLLPGWLVGSAHAAPGEQVAPRDLRRGQVVVFYRDPGRRDDPLIKRLIGLPGETIAIRDQHVYIGGAVLAEPYLNGLATDCTAVCGPLALGPDEYFFMGDNRPVSLDSRVFGPIPGSRIVGRVVARFWPPDALALYP
jgi:signal peptidase I